MKIALAIPTYNAGSEFSNILAEIKSQSSVLNYIKIVDSSSTDNTVEIANQFEIETEVIPKEKFSHGGTRTKLAVEMRKNGFDFLIFMSQDVSLQENALDNIIDFMLLDDKLGVVYGKQEVCLEKGNIFEYYARKFNYHDSSEIKTQDDISKLGIKTIFSSDAFAIYNLQILENIGYFGSTANVSEDMLVADKIIRSNYKVGYCAEAKVFHTHNYSIIQEYKRYIKIGKFYKDNRDIVSRYGKTNENGVKLAMGELIFLIQKGYFYLVPESIFRNLAKFVGHKIGSVI